MLFGAIKVKIPQKATAPLKNVKYCHFNSKQLIHYLIKIKIHNSSNIPVGLKTYGYVTNFMYVHVRPASPVSKYAYTATSSIRSFQRFQNFGKNVQ